LARDYTSIVEKLADSVEGLDRLKGHIVKFDEENEKALILVEGNEESGYRWVDRELLNPLGLMEEGQAFVLWEQSADPDNAMYLFLPAIESKLMPDDEFEKEVELLREAETPLRDYEAPSY
jgi:hypothetical protein